jgi:hypothetical protein
VVIYREMEVIDYLQFPDCIENISRIEKPLE